MNSLDVWAAEYGVAPEALDELRAILTTEHTDPEPAAGQSEAAVQTAIRLEATRAGARLWRNNVGAYKAPDGSFVRYGLANESKKMNDRFKSSDLIGINPILITPAHVGKIIGQFVAREVKAGGWTFKNTARERAQLNFVEFIAGMGGDAAIVSDVGSLTPRPLSDTVRPINSRELTK